MENKNNFLNEETKGKKVQKLLTSLKRLGSVMGEGKIFTCSNCGEKKRITLAMVNEDWREICFCYNCATLKVLESFFGKDYVEKLRKEWETKLKRLELNPLSVAKYFYEKWTISDPVIMQRFIYFTYLKVLEKEDVILFEEKFQAWPGGPVLESVIYPMYDNCEDLSKFFAQVEEIEEWNIFVLDYLKKTAKKYSNLNSSETYREARNKLWAEASDDESDNNPIDENSLFIFIQESRRQPLSPSR